VGKEFDAYFNDVIRNKIDMDGSWIWTDNDHVYYSTARSMARYGILILGKGKWGHETIMSDAVYLNEMINPSQIINKSYGYLWWLNGNESFMLRESQIVFPGSPSPNAPADMFSGLGKNGQYISIVPSQNIIVIRMGEDPSNALVPFMFLDDIWSNLKVIIK
jgi:CubicO group peptidase (beta-lactamase class C family)